MLKSLAYKEWIKLRLYWALIFLANLAFTVFLCLQLRRVCKTNELLAVWSNWLFKDYLFFRACEYGPLLLGVIFGSLQFFPEIINKRLRLVLHLPLGEARAVGAHLLVGLGLLTLIFLPAAGLLAGYAGIWFPREFAVNLAYVYAPWLLGGYAAYILAAFTLLEPTWRLRVFFFLFSAALVRLYFFTPYYDSYGRVLPGLGLLTAALTILPLLSAHRFGKGYGS
ncbi:MAG: hypothetical protein P4N60_05040 [Verrucomicrobiae bacterium]|nr:hypothetical protein [Verrucomicrobiae bacterium]